MGLRQMWMEMVDLLNKTGDRKAASVVVPKDTLNRWAAELNNAIATIEMEMLRAEKELKNKA